MPNAGTAVAAGAMSLPAPAKVNLGLRVLGRRDDGYHLLESVFVPLDLHDEVTVRIEPAAAPGVSLRVESASDASASALDTVPDDARNLAHRAADAFLAAASLSARVEVVLAKRIPAAAGLGGGSSDAAAVLRALTELAPGRVGDGQLREMALALGADVPFFLDPRPAWVTGIGENVEPLEAVPALDLVMANPGVALPTAEVFRAWDALASSLTPPPAGSTLRALSALLASDASDFAARADALGALLENDLEVAAVRLCPPVRRLRQTLSEAGALATGMSGSGATVFGVFPGPQEAAACLENLAPGARGWVRLAATGGAG